MEKGSLLDLEASSEVGCRQTPAVAPSPAILALAWSERRPPCLQAALNPQTLSFQEFSSSGSALAGSSAPQDGSRMGSQMGSQALKPAQDTGGFSDPSAAAVPTGSAAFWTITYYQPLFDVDTVQVLNRVKGSLLPRPRGAFFELIAANPDLYGPFWVATTLIFAMAITGNLASYLAFVPKMTDNGKMGRWQYDFSQARPPPPTAWVMRWGGLTHAPVRPAPCPPAPPAAPLLLAAQLTVAGSVIYSYVTLLPLLFWLLLRYYEASKKLADVLCIYGYTMAIFVPISVLCVLPSNLLRWLLVLLGGGARTLTPHTTTPPAAPRPAAAAAAGPAPAPPPVHPPAPPRTERVVGVAQPSPRSSSSPTLTNPNLTLSSHLLHLPPLELPCAPGRLLPVRRGRREEEDLLPARPHARLPYRPRLRLQGVLLPLRVSCCQRGTGLWGSATGQGVSNVERGR